jgi:hypothetical protein
LSKIKLILLLVAGSLLSILAGNAAEQETIYLGLTEPYHIHWTGEKPKTAFVIRIAFQHKNGVWTAMPHQVKDGGDLRSRLLDYPKAINWNVCFDGKKIGTFRSHLPFEWFYYSEIGLHDPDKKAAVPSIKTGLKDFHYWNGAWAAPVRSRPLVASSGNDFEDPDFWKPRLPPPPPSYKLVSAYRAALEKYADYNDEQIFPDKHHIVQDGDALLAAPASEEEGALQFDKVRVVVSKCYKSRKGDELLKLAARGSEKNAEERFVQWFLVQRDKITFLGENLELIDAGDYDHDGHSEIVFHKGGYDYDAYVLVWDDLQKQIEFGWTYH